MTRSVFYFDDDESILRLFQEMFEHEYDVRTASRLEDARRMLAERPADIVISDQSMPEISGTEFLAEIARSHPESYRVMLTGSILVYEAIPEITSGIVQLFIAKPWTPEAMQEILDRATSQRG